MEVNLFFARSCIFSLVAFWFWMDGLDWTLDISQTYIGYWNVHLNVGDKALIGTGWCA